MKLHRGDLSQRERASELNRVLEAVGLTPVADTRRRFPYELSGGQRQRVGFAQALALRPKLIVADEPVSMLDVSIRVGVLNLMGELREREGVSFLYITHDVASARYLADRVLVMYAGHLVEEGATEDVLQRPKHPYTQLLLAAVPDPRAELGIADARDVGEPPKVVDPKPGCRFRPRCPLAIAKCETVTPELRELARRTPRRLPRRRLKTSHGRAPRARGPGRRVRLRAGRAPRARPRRPAATAPPASTAAARPRAGRPRSPRSAARFPPEAARRPEPRRPPRRRARAA